MLFRSFVARVKRCHRMGTRAPQLGIRLVVFHQSAGRHHERTHVVRHARQCVGGTHRHFHGVTAVATGHVAQELDGVHDFTLLTDLRRLIPVH